MYCYLRLVLVLDMSPVCEGEGECGEEEGGGCGGHGDPGSSERPVSSPPFIPGLYLATAPRTEIATTVNGYFYIIRGRESING